MSESLQKFAGGGLRNILSKITANKWRGVLTGLLVTGLIQSSSAVTVMVVSFVNAGILTLSESFGLIMGANIGTTVTAWIISVLGFGKTFTISSITLPLIALALPFFFSSNSRHRSFSEFIFGFGILFFGLSLLKEQVPMVDQSADFLRSLIEFNASSHFISVLIFVGLGIALTIIFQSSSATIALTTVMATGGWIPFDLAAGMVLGENIGTTSTAIFASLVANAAAKRAAMTHLIFNILGVTWALLFFRFLTLGVDHIMNYVTGLSPYTDMLAIPASLAIFHTGFNILNTLLLMGFSDKIIRLTYYIIPTKNKKKEKFRLTYLDSRFLSTSELSLVQAKKEVAMMGKDVLSMFNTIPYLLIEKDSQGYDKLLKKIEKFEKQMDKREKEIAIYLSHISEGQLSSKGTLHLQAMLRIIDEIEAIGDSCYKMSLTIKNKNELNLYFIQDLRDRLNSLFAWVREALEVMCAHLSSDFEKIRLDEPKRLEYKINKLRDKLQKEHLQSQKEEKYNYRTGLVYSDLITQAEKIGDYALNVSESIENTQHPD